MSEAAFFSTYGTMFGAYFAEQKDAEEARARLPADERERPFVKDSLARIDKGGYTEAFARIAYLLGRKGEPLPLARVTMRQELAKDYANLVPDLPLDQWRRIRGEQEIIVQHEPERALTTLPELLDAEERERLLVLIERVVTDKRVQESKPTAEQIAMVERIRTVLSGGREPAQGQLGMTIKSMEGSRHEPQT
jgi:hypothetical protein